MESVRLTNDKRATLQKHIANKAFNKKKNKLEALWTKFADDCYNTTYNEDERNRMLRDPNMKHAYKISSVVDRYSFNGQSYCGWKNYLIHTSMSESRPFWNNIPDQRHRFDKDHPLTKRFIKLTAMSQDLLGEIGALNAEINAVIKGCNTTKQLLINWPECEAFLIGSGITKQAPAPVPMKRPDALNEKLCGILGKKSPTCKEVTK